MSLTASGKEISIGPDTVKSLSVIQNIHNSTPVLQGVIHDIYGMHAKYNVFGDGAQLVVDIGPGDSSSKSTNFRRFNTPDVKNGNGGDTISFSAQYDAPKLRNLHQKAMPDMSSSDAIKSALGAVGIKFEGHSTSDIMTWLPNNRPLHQWLRHVADHGYASAKSAMHLAMGSRGDGAWTMLYKDMIKQAQSSPIIRLVSQGFEKSSDITILASNWRSHSGTLNNAGGYSGQTQQVDKTGLVKLFAQVAAGKSMSSLDMSSVVKAAVSKLPIHFLQHDVGNTHANFAVAKHQNARLKQTFTSFLSILTHDYTNLRIMDPVQAVIMQGTSMNETQSGTYVVHSRTQHASGTFYREKIVLAAQGVNAKSGSS
jgi:hypothetical protein